jgi:hypothetical protein
MAKLSAIGKQPLIKMLYLGYSGEGKSTSLIPLGIPGYLDNPGYELRILDFDGKAEEVVRATLARLLKEKAITQEQHDKALTENYDICPCLEVTGVVSGREGKRTIKKLGIEGTATAWNTAVKQLEKWNPTFSDKTILVVDSFTYAVRAITNFSQELNGKLNQALEWRDYQGPQHLAEMLMVTCADLPTHVIVCGHQDPLELYKATDKLDDKGQPVEDLIDTLMVPISIGRAGRMKLPARFNHLLVASSEGKGASVRRYIYTEPRVGVVTKTPFYGLCETRYPLDKGMVEYFKLGGNVHTK